MNKSSILFVLFLLGLGRCTSVAVIGDRGQQHQSLCLAVRRGSQKYSSLSLSSFSSSHRRRGYPAYHVYSNLDCRHVDVEAGSCRPKRHWYSPSLFSLPPSHCVPCFSSGISPPVRRVWDRHGVSWRRVRLYCAGTCAEATKTVGSSEGGSAFCDGDH